MSVVRLSIETPKLNFTYDYEGDGPLVVGRLKECDLRIADSDVSRKHLRIERTAVGFVVIDEGSRNGVLVNGKRLEGSASIAIGDLLQLGPAVSVRFGEPGSAKLKAAAGSVVERAASAKPMAAAPAAGVLIPASVAAATSPERQAPPSAHRAKLQQRLSTALMWGAVLGLCTFLGFYGFWLLTGGGLSGPGPQRPVAVEPPPTTPSEEHSAVVVDDEATGAWKRLQAKQYSLAPDLLIGALADFAEQYPASPLAAQATRRQALLQRVIEQTRNASVAAISVLERELHHLTGADRFADAWYLIQAGPRLGLGTDAQLARFARRVEQQAYESFSAVRERGRALLAKGQPFAAYQLVAIAGLGLSGLPFAAEVEAELLALARSTEHALRQGAVTAGPVKAADRGRLEQLRPLALTALLHCQFDKAIAAYREMLGLPLTADERTTVEYQLFDAHRLRELYLTLLAEVAVRSRDKMAVRVTLAEGLKGIVTDADGVGIRIEPELKGETGQAEVVRRWANIEPAMVAQMFLCLDQDAQTLIATASYCFQAGLEHTAHDVLIAIYQRWPAFRSDAAALLSRYSETHVAVDDLVVFEGRLVAKSERDTIRSGREAARERARALAEELAAAKKEAKAKDFFEQAQLMFEQGQYEAAHSVLAAIVKKFAGTESANEAKARMEDPFLRRRELTVTGADTNRVSIVFLAEGYQLKDDRQRSFDATANRAKAMLTKAEPWAEYAGYFNTYAMNLWSKDQGVDREEGNVIKETAVGGRVANGVFTVNNGLARGFVERFPGPSVAVCLGNDSASVATGGGGVCAVVKGMISVCAHEIGHAFVGLGDEYSMDPTPNSGGPKERATGKLPTQILRVNLIYGNQKDDMRAKAPWKHWIALGVNNWTGQPVDLFEGGNRVPFDVWRPQPDCKMRTSGSRFCPVCMEQMVLGIYGAIRPIDEVSPKDEEVTVKATEKPLFRIATLMPRSKPLSCEFILKRTVDETGASVQREKEKPRSLKGEGVPLPDGRFGYAARATKLKPGRYTVTATVKDTTIWVAQADRSRLEQSHVWTLIVEP